MRILGPPRRGSSPGPSRRRTRPAGRPPRPPRTPPGLQLPPAAGPRRPSGTGRQRSAGDPCAGGGGPRPLVTAADSPHNIRPGRGRDEQRRNHRESALRAGPSADAGRRGAGGRRVPGVGAHGNGGRAYHAGGGRPPRDRDGPGVPAPGPAAQGLLRLHAGEARGGRPPVLGGRRDAARVPGRGVGRGGGRRQRVGAGARGPRQRPAGGQAPLGQGRRPERVERPGRLQRGERLPRRLAHDRAGRGRGRQPRVEGHRHDPGRRRDRPGPPLPGPQGGVRGGPDRDVPHRVEPAHHGGVVPPGRRTRSSSGGGTSTGRGR